MIPEQEKMDGWLRQAMSGEPVPALSPDFEGRLTKRLRPRRLSAKGRLLLAGYAVVAVALSVWVMRSHSIDWPWIAAACVAPVAVAAVVYTESSPSGFVSREPRLARHARAPSSR